MRLVTIALGARALPIGLLGIALMAQVPAPGPQGGGGGGVSITAGCGLSGGSLTGTIAQNIVTAAHNGSYVVVTGDCGTSLTTNTTASWTLSQAGATGFTAGWGVVANNTGSGALTITATTSTFYGGQTGNISGSVLTVPANTSAQIISDGANYQVISGGGGSVTGPSSSTTGNVPRFSDTTGKVIGTGLPVTTAGTASSLIETDASGNVVASGAVKTGSSPPSVTVGTGGVVAGNEGTDPSGGCPAAGVDCIVFDSAQHKALLSANNAALSPICTIASGCGAAGYDPNDVTAYYNDTVFQPLGSYSNVTGNFWAFNGDCSGVLTGGTYGNPTAGQFRSYMMGASSGNPCGIYAPYAGGNPSTTQMITDFVSSSVVLPWKLEVLYGRNTSSTDGDQWIGISQSPVAGATTATFAGLHYKYSSSLWLCEAYGSSVSLASSTVTGASVDTNFHWMRVSNGAGVANSITCSVGSASVTITPTIPSGDWVFVMGPAGVTGALTPRAVISEARVSITGRAAN